MEAVEGRRALPMKPELLRIARRLVWWMPPEEALGEPWLFLAQVMTLGTWEDIEAVRLNLGEAVFGQTLDHAPPGVFEAPSWHYWHRRVGRSSIPPLPKRRIP